MFRPLPTWLYILIGLVLEASVSRNDQARRYAIVFLSEATRGESHDLEHFRH
jgi:hypothetical protein